MFVPFTSAKATEALATVCGLAEVTAGRLDVHSLTPGEAAALHKTACKARKVLAGVEMSLAARVAASEQWKGQGDRTASRRRRGRPSCRHRPQAGEGTELMGLAWEEGLQPAEGGRANSGREPERSEGSGPKPTTTAPPTPPKRRQHWATSTGPAPSTTSSKPTAATPSKQAPAAASSSPPNNKPADNTKPPKRGPPPHGTDRSSTRAQPGFRPGSGGFGHIPPFLTEP
jgi:hypothetical protein